MRQTATFDYYYGMQADAYSFYRIPKVLFTSDYFKGLSCEAKVLYGLMLDRMSLSIKNRWFDEENRVYIIFTVEEAMELMSCSKPKAVKLIAELDSEKGIGLIEKKRLGLGKANIIYVKNFLISDTTDDEPQEENSGHQAQEEGKKGAQTRINTQKSNILTSGSKENELLEVKEFNFSKSKNLTSGSKESELLEVKKLNRNYTDINDTEYSDTDLSIHQGKKDAMEEYMEYEAIIKDNIEYDALCQSYDKREVDEIVELMLETVCSTKEAISINGELKPAVVVKSRFLKISYTHIQYVFECMDNNSSDVRNIRQYMLTVLYNAPTMISHYYQSRVKYDMANGMI